MLGGNVLGQLVVLDENDSEIFSYPPQPPFNEETLQDYYIFINEGEVKCKYIDSNDVLWTLNLNI